MMMIFFLNKYFIIFSKVQTFYSILYLYKFIRRFTDIKYSFLLRDLVRLQDINDDDDDDDDGLILGVKSKQKIERT